MDRLEDEVVWEGKLRSWLLGHWHYMYSWDQAWRQGSWRFPATNALRGGLSFPALKGLGVEPFSSSAVMERQSNLSGALVLRAKSCVLRCCK